jgi:hypothetical protein
LWKKEVHLHLRNDSPSFHPVHALIRAFGPRVLHQAKGNGQLFKGSSVIYLEFKLFIAEVEELLENEHLEQDQRVDPLALALLLRS